MSVAGVSNLSQLSTIQKNFQQLRSQFSQLGQDLSSGNLTQAQTDFVTLSQAAATQLGSNSPVSRALSTIGQALQSGNVSAAQQAYSTLPPGLVGPNAVNMHSHSHHGHGGLSQELQQLGQALQSGDLSAAQQAFAAIQQGWPQLAGSSSTSSSGSLDSLASSAAAVSVTA